jgi:predicted PilT family ATPase
MNDFNVNVIAGGITSSLENALYESAEIIAARSINDEMGAQARKVQSRIQAALREVDKLSHMYKRED